jgi:Zn finger protein HypA/HybF involved in hydrogenase expression
MKSMQTQLLSELFAFANALIIFDDTTISYELELFYNEAELRNLPIIVVPFNQKEGLCPKCGRRMILKDGKAFCPKCYHRSLVSY